jgi:CIC family chloride channel protein
MQPSPNLAHSLHVGKRWLKQSRILLVRRLPLGLLRSDSFILTALALAIGVLAGFGAHIFHLALEGIHNLWALLGSVLGPSVPSEWITLVAPIGGSLAALALIHFFASKDSSHGTSAVIESVALRGGRLPGRALLVKVAAAATFIGSGASAGPEDPSVQLGGVAGSMVSRLLRLSEQRTRTLVASGVAAAVAAAFNAPIAGVFFALEVVVGELQAALFPPVVLASVAASAISRWLNGNHTVFQIPSYGLSHPLVELPMYAVLGVMTALVGVFFVRLLFRCESLLSSLGLSKPTRAVGIGLAIGLVGLWLPDALGVGYTTVGQALGGHMVDPLGVALLLVVKLFLTALCIAAIGVGGTFAPALFLGAMTGTLIGMLADVFVPGTPPAAFALVGMGGVLTAVVRAPITAVLLLFELTNDYRIILPIMLCVAVSNMVARLMMEESVYTERLVRHGIRLRAGIDQSVMETVLVGDAMSRRFNTIEATRPIGDALQYMTDAHFHGLPVVEEGRLVGIVTTSDIARALESGTDESVLVGEIASTDVLIAYPDLTLHDAIPLFAVHDVRQVPVVSRTEEGRVVGILRRTDIMRSYHAGVVMRKGRGAAEHPPQTSDI